MANQKNQNNQSNNFGQQQQGQNEQMEKQPDVSKRSGQMREEDAEQE